MLDRAGKGKQNGGKAGETKCRRADWVAWLERVSPSSMMWVRRTHGYQRREAESGSGGTQCSPIQLWVSRKEAGTFTKKKKKKSKEWKAALWEKHGESRVAEQPEWALPHAPKSLTLIPECWLWLQRATQIWCLLQKKPKKKQSTKHEAQVHLLASLLCMRGMTQCMGWSVSGGGGTSYTVRRYVIYQTTVNTVTSRAKTGGSRHQTDART